MPFGLGCEFLLGSVRMFIPGWGGGGKLYSSLPKFHRDWAVQPTKHFCFNSTPMPLLISPNFPSRQSCRTNQPFPASSVSPSGQAEAVAVAVATPSSHHQSLSFLSHPFCSNPQTSLHYTTRSLAVGGREGDSALTIWTTAMGWPKNWLVS